ncbi:MAG: NAD(P)H-hydrate dehydratase [Gemmataceae bacterium]|nr:NAD(P)H-hydrate dehydratase [Gemmataceae bacterium]
MNTPVQITDVPKIPARKPDSHKGTYGKVLVIAGSRGMAGAAILSASGALRGGAGLVQVGCPSEIAPIVASGNPCYMTASLSQDLRGRMALSCLNEIMPLANEADVLLVGPGWGRSETLTKLLKELIECANLPMILDADALHALSELPKSILFSRIMPTLITPHPGEFAKLTGRTTEEVQASRQELALLAARERNCCVVLKGHQTIVTDGKRLYRNTTGNAGMATGGTGDVLAGLLSGLMAQGIDPFDAAQIATYVHGRAGDLAAAELGQTAMIASDLLDYLPAALKELGG